MKEYIPIIISILSFIVATFALGWNIYRDIILKARIKVSIMVASIISPGVKESPQYVNLTILNLNIMHKNYFVHKLFKLKMLS